MDVRVAGHRTLPPGLRAVLIDPGTRRHRPVHAPGHQPVRVALAADTTSPDPSAPPADSPSATPTASAPPSDSPSATPPAGPSDSPTPSASASPTPKTSTAPRPAIISRAGWGADESLVATPNAYGQTVKAVFVHHTDTGNTYSCADSAAVVRSIFLYHVKTNGWNDIGYNFLVDKCGTLYEGRSGGVDRPVIGAHAYGFNTDSAGVAVLGTFTDAAPPQAALDTVAKVAAWKLGLDGGDPTGTTTLTEGVKDGNFPYQSSVTFKTISGHRNANSTACPGQLLYDKLPAIRTAAAQWTKPADLTSTSLSGATKVNSTYYTKGTVTLGWHAAAVTGYDLLDNSTAIAHPAASALSATTTLHAGSHQLQVVAHNIDGTTTKSPLFPLVADTAKPVFGTPAALSLRTGTVSSTKIPVSLKWKVTDDRLLRSVKATSPSATTFPPTTTSWSAYAKPATSTAWSLSAADAAGNTATSSATRTTSVRSDSSSSRTGTWKTTTNSQYLGGTGLYSSAKGATASWTVTTRSVALINKAPRAPASSTSTSTVSTRPPSTPERPRASTGRSNGPGPGAPAPVTPSRSRSPRPQDDPPSPSTASPTSAEPEPMPRTTAARGPALCRSSGCDFVSSGGSGSAGPCACRPARKDQSAAGPTRDVMHIRTQISHLRRVVWGANRAKELDLPRLAGGAPGSDDLDSALRAARNGDEDAFRTLYRQIHPRLLRYVGTLVGDDAEDVTAEAWSHIARDIASFDGDVDGFRGWTAAIARGRALDRLHDRKGRAIEKAPDGDFLELPAGDGIDKTASESSSTGAALALIARLPADQAEIIVLRVVVGLDTKTVAKVLGKRTGTVRAAAHRGLRRLEHLLNGLEHPR